MDQNLVRQCLQCSADISHRARHAKYCSKTCKVLAWQHNNPEKHAASRAETRARRKPQAAKEAREWRASNPGRQAALNKQSYQRNREEVLTRQRTYGLRCAGAAPPWLSPEQLEKIAGFYAEARRLTRETGVKHEVDHIEPLNGPASCGLHVPWNLQVLTMKENKSKGNKVPDALAACVSALEQ